jgi:hypothetical protein|tara:strand:+ start:312 stop:470 length:159 start_codon:yes stop_codon:yes gene_type:complete
MTLSGCSLRGSGERSGCVFFFFGFAFFFGFDLALLFKGDEELPGWQKRCASP